MFRKSFLTLVSILSLGSALLAQTPSPTPPVPPATTITTLPFQITAPGTYVLAKNLTLTGNQAAIIIGTSFYGPPINGPVIIGGPVVIDLGGFTISANSSSAGGTGILVNSINNGTTVSYPVTVQNGTITGFQSGASIGLSSNVTISHIVFKNVPWGVQIGSSSDIAIDNCKFNGSQTGIQDSSPEGGNSYHHTTFVNCQTDLYVSGSRLTTAVLGNCHFNDSAN
jgi:hypothetical protein